MVKFNTGLDISSYLIEILSTSNCKASSNCENPEAQLDDSVEVIGYLSKAAAVKGSNISFSCPPGLVLTGPNSSTCLGNGEWEPDPRDVKCKGECDNNTCIEGVTILLANNSNFTQ